MTTLFGCDQIEDVFESARERHRRGLKPLPGTRTGEVAAPEEPREDSGVGG